jgi:acyl-coenzyme A synthetase/AMP-(fatty) acid ligase
MVRIVEEIITTSQKYREKTAIIDRSGAVTYGELEEQVYRTASYFQASGIRAGQKVLVLVPYSVHLYRVTLALNYLGAAAIFIEDWITFRQMGWVCKVAKPDALITHSTGLLFSYLMRPLRKIPLRLHHERYQKHDPLHKEPDLQEEDIAMISFTSGTSGQPKMIRRSYGFLHHQFHTLKEVKESRLDEIELQTMPAFLLINLVTGGTSVIADFNKLKPHRTDYRKIELQLRHHKVNTLCASPAFLKKLAQRGVWPSIRTITTGGSPVFPQDARLFNTAFPNAQIRIIYGSSEAEPISVIESQLLAESSVSENLGLNAGLIHPGAEVRIRPVFGEYQLNYSQKIGEIQVAGPNVLGHQEGQWHATGDSGFISKHNELILTGPVSSVITHRDQLWSPFLIEGLANQVEGVKRAALVLAKEYLVLAVEPHAGVNRQRLQQSLHQLALPLHSIHFYKELPKDRRHGGKIRYEQLKRQLERHL